MKSNTRLLVILLIAAIGIGFGITKLRNHSQGSGDALGESTDEDSSESLPVIDFPLLDQARPLDLIEMDLDFPDSVKELEGKRVSLIGFMAPFDSLDDMRRCMMVPSYVGCTFCSPPSLSQVVYVTQGKDDSARRRPYPFIEEPSYVTGTLRLSVDGSTHEGKEQGFLYSLENAVIEPYTGDAPKRAAVHGMGAAGQPDHQQGEPLPPVEFGDLVQEVAEILGQESHRSIKVEKVSDENFLKLLQTDVEKTFPEPTRSARIQAFRLLGLIPEEVDWIDRITMMELAIVVALADETGETIHQLDFLPAHHSYVRLELVGAISDALTRQQFHAQMEKFEENDDSRRAFEALREGLRGVAIYRYSRSHGISPASKPPVEFLEAREVQPFVSGFDLWHTLPADVGPFFVDSFVGSAGPFSQFEPVLAQPPTTTIAIFRPSWYRDPTLWRQDPVPGDFADNLLETPPTLTDVFGIGGLVPWLAMLHPMDVAKSLAGSWAGDRWAVWQFPDGSSALILETRWQDEDSAIEFSQAIPDHAFQSILHDPGSTSVRLLRADSATALEGLASAVADDP